ncbi:hypothetical protein FB451DRAFT_1402908 [Mycena latifolia]|nr:hypothetical protein FB451DRAFT_1402908 [Mycena latifolia]
MLPAHITAIQPFTSSSPPPQPLVVSLWATDIHYPPTPIPAAHQEVAKLTNIPPSGKTANRAKELKVDIPPAAVSIVPSVTAEATPAGAGSTTPLGAPGTPVSRPRPTARVDDSTPASPLTDLNSDTSESESNPEMTKIARPKNASRFPLPMIFNDWTLEQLEGVQEHIKKLAKIHLMSGANFKSQAQTFTVFGKFPFLKLYANNWATIRLLQAHLKTKRVVMRTVVL